MPQTREHVLLARQVSVPHIVVFLNKVRHGRRPRAARARRARGARAAEQVRVPGRRHADHPGLGAEVARRTTGDDAANKCIDELMDALDATFRTPIRALDKPFLMPIEDVFSITGRGTVATGRVERGIVQGRRRGGDRRHQGHQEDDRDGRGDVPQAARPGSGGRQHRRAAARAWTRRTSSAARCWRSPARSRRTRSSRREVYVLTKEEGGRHTPFFNGYRPQFYFRTTDVTGRGDLPEGVGDGDAGRQRRR